jgi:hypothetical protein
MVAKTIRRSRRAGRSDGCIEHIDSFQSESEINDWISRKSDAWLKARGK